MRRSADDGLDFSRDFSHAGPLRTAEIPANPPDPDRRMGYTGGRMNPDPPRAHPAPSEPATTPLRDLPGLFDTLYRELRALAAQRLAHERPDHTLEPTALVNEAFLRLVGSSFTIHDRAHFLVVAARAMRRVLIDHARGRDRLKRGGSGERMPLDMLDFAPIDTGEELLVVDDLISQLAELNPRHAELVECRVFGGRTVAEVAEAFGYSESTAESDWRIARAWLRSRLADASER
jgi:RNA polymerase sigma-70 factor (ECF subfamily)